MTSRDIRIPMASRSDELERTFHECQRWSRNAERLLAALIDVGSENPRLSAKLEALRHRRDTLINKAEALDRHRGEDRARALAELEVALQDVRASWRSVLGSLDRESAHL